MADEQKKTGRAVFVAGTDTSVGKTYFCAGFLAYLLHEGVKAGYQKWVSTGDEKEMAEDLSYCSRVAGLQTSNRLMQDIVPYSFSLPASPHLAAAVQGEEIKTHKIIAAYETLKDEYELLIVEGAGGSLVPLRRDLLLIDLVAQLNIPVILVARSGLGTINHTLLTIEAMRHRQMTLLGIVFSDEDKGLDERIVSENLQIIKNIGRTEILGRLTRDMAPQTEVMVEAMSGIGAGILAGLDRLSTALPL